MGKTYTSIFFMVMCVGIAIAAVCLGIVAIMLVRGANPKAREIISVYPLKPELTIICYDSTRKDCDTTYTYIQP